MELFFSSRYIYMYDKVKFNPGDILTIFTVLYLYKLRSGNVSKDFLRIPLEIFSYLNDYLRSDLTDLFSKTSFEHDM